MDTYGTFITSIACESVLALKFPGLASTTSISCTTQSTPFGTMIASIPNPTVVKSISTRSLTYFTSSCYASDRSGLRILSRRTMCAMISPPLTLKLVFLAAVARAGFRIATGLVLNGTKRLNIGTGTQGHNELAICC